MYSRRLRFRISSHKPDINRLTIMRFIAQENDLAPNISAGCMKSE